MTIAFPVHWSESTIRVLNNLLVRWRSMRESLWVFMLHKQKRRVQWIFASHTSICCTWHDFLMTASVIEEGQISLDKQKYIWVSYQSFHAMRQRLSIGKVCWWPHGWCWAICWCWVINSLKCPSLISFRMKLFSVRWSSVLWPWFWW